MMMMAAGEAGGGSEVTVGFWRSGNVDEKGGKTASGSHSEAATIRSNTTCRESNKHLTAFVAPPRQRMWRRRQRRLS